MTHNIHHIQEFIRAFFSPAPIMCKLTTSEELTTLCNDWLTKTEGTPEKVIHEDLITGFVSMGFTCMETGEGEAVYFNISPDNLNECKEIIKSL